MKEIEVISTDGAPARSCVQVAALPRGAKIKIDAIAVWTMQTLKRRQKVNMFNCWRASA